MDWAAPGYAGGSGLYPREFSSAEEYKRFLFEYLKIRCLPDAVQKHICEIEK